LRESDQEQSAQETKQIAEEERLTDSSLGFVLIAQSDGRSSKWRGDRRQVVDQEVECKECLIRCYLTRQRQRTAETSNEEGVNRVHDGNHSKLDHLLTQKTG
jgi:hypothetical protein